MSRVEKEFRNRLNWKIKGANKIQNYLVGYCVSGELFAFLGLGSFKTDLLQSIAGCGDPSLDQIYLNGERIFKPTPHFSYLNKSEDSHVLYDNLTILETLCFSAELRNPSRIQPSEITSVRLLTTMGMESMSEVLVGNLSLYHRRMVLLGTEIVAGKEIVFFDNPTADLDATSALSCIAALQRVARTGKLVAITAGSLTFREYAILDRIQLLTSDSLIYFGAASGALSYFSHHGKTPAPGASISDFLFDLVEDIDTGYVDAATLERTADRHSQAITLRFESQKRSTNAYDDNYSALYSSGARRTLVKRASSNPQRLTYRAWLADTKEWLQDFECLNIREEDLPRMPLSFKQFTWCFWRAFVVRARHMDQVVGVNCIVGLVAALAVLIAFYGSINYAPTLHSMPHHNSEEVDVDGAEAIKTVSRCVYLSLISFILVALPGLWVEMEKKHNSVFAFERERGYYSPFFFPLSAILANFIVFRLVPCLLFTLICYPLLCGIFSWTNMLVYFHVLCLLALVSAGFSQLIINLMAYSNDFHPVKGVMVSLLLYSIQWAYSGLFPIASLSYQDNTGLTLWQSFLTKWSMFYWGYSVLIHNEIFYSDSIPSTESPSSPGFGSSTSSSDTVAVAARALLHNLHHHQVQPKFALFTLWIQAAIYLVLSVGVSFICHRDRGRLRPRKA